MGNKIRSIDSSINTNSIHQPEVKARLPITAEKALTIYLTQLNDQLNDMLDNADDHFFDKSGKSDDSRHFAALRTLRVKKKALLNSFEQNIVTHFRKTIGKFESREFQTEVVQDYSSFEGLSLVDNNELEEQIAIDSMVNKARKHNQVALEHLMQRLDILLPAKAISTENNPFDPLVVCDAFSQALKPIDLDVEFQLVLYKYFDRIIIEDLELIYQDINQSFIESGILPELKSSLIKRKLSSSIKTKQPSSESATDGLGEEGREILSILSELLATKRGTEVTGATQQVQTQELVNALSTIQLSQPVDALSTNQLHDVRQQLSHQLSNSTGGQINNGALGQFNDDMIDVVTMLFDFILDDGNLDSEIKAIIARLQIPILKVGLVDKTFFSNRKHSARVLLNELAHAGLSCEKNDQSSQLMIAKIKDVVESICSEFNDDISVFEKMLLDFAAFKSDYSKRAKIFEKRTCEAEEGKARAEGARSRVNRELTRICRGQRVPEIVQQLFKQVWVHVMFLEALKADDESWEIVTRLAKMMVWSVQPVKDQTRLDKLTKTVPVLIKNLKLGFNKISFSHMESSGLLDRLEDEHRQIIKDAREFIKAASKDSIIRLKPLSPFTQNAEQAEQPDSNAETELVSEEIEEIVIEEIAFTEAEIGLQASQKKPNLALTEKSRSVIENLHAGCWFELKLDGEFKRCKLAARIVSSGKFIFVNRSGVKIAEYLSDDLAAEYQTGNLKIFDDEALFDRALESIISNLRDMKA